LLLAGVDRQTGPRPQVDALTAVGIPAETIYMDKRSDATADRPGLRALLDYTRAGDVLARYREGTASRGAAPSRC
jgi:DNA invertase Pin-like site-specific DNA recombinase